MANEGSQGLARIVAAARQRKEEKEQQQRREAPRPEPVQGPPRRIERPTMRQEPRQETRRAPEVQHTNYHTPYTGTPEIESSYRGPIYNPEDHSQYGQDTNTVGYMEPSRRESQNRPPRPNVMPEITPVAALKNRVARDQQYSDNARDILYNTPTRMRWSPLDPGIPLADAGHIDSGQQGMTEGEGIGGWYFHPAPRYWSEIDQINSGRGRRPPEIEMANFGPGMMPEDILAHEFGHKWFYEQLPSNDQLNWHIDWPNVVHDRTMKRTIGRQLPDNAAQAVESYAHYTEHGPYAMPPEHRNRWYPGLYREGIPYVPDAAAQDELYAREIASQRTPFSTEYWVPESNVPFGYYSDGTSAPPPMTERRWGNGWPALKLYEFEGR